MTKRPHIIKTLLKYFLVVLAIPVVYIALSFLLMSITINSSSDEGDNSKSIFLSTNGRHLTIIAHKKDLEESLLHDLNYSEHENYFSFAWGDEDFYLNTRLVRNLTLKKTFKTLFQKSSTLIRLTRYQNPQKNWVEINVTEIELKKINQLLLNSFRVDENGKKIIVPGAGYLVNDDFYKANGSYTCCNTCNTWVNTIFKESGLKSCYWTPFDFGLLNKYK